VERQAEGAWAWALGLVKLTALAFFLLGLASCAASLSPGESFKDYRNDMGSALATFFIAQGVAARPAVIRRMLAVALATSAYLAALNILAFFRFAGGDEIERLYWMQSGLIYSPDYWFHRQATDFRPMFPFGHHNRLSNFAMMASGAGLMLLAWPRMGWKRRALAFAGFALAFATLNLTFGRGAWLAFGAGLGAALLLLFQPRRWSHWVALGAFALSLAGAHAMLPEGQKERVQKALSQLLPAVAGVADEEAAADMDMNVLRRVIAMETALRVVQRYPWLGVGYGT